VALSWDRDYNHHRRHPALGWQTHAHYAADGMHR